MGSARLDAIHAALAGVTGQIAAGAAERDRQARFEIAPFELLHGAGLLAYGLPEALGGAGGSLGEVGVILREVARADASVGLVLSMYYNAHLSAGLNGGWPVERHRLLVGQALAGPSLVNGAQSEPALGSPNRGGPMQTCADRIPGGWRISGHKNYVTGSEGLAWFSVLARTAEGNIGSWLVPADAPGIAIVPTWRNLGMRATSSHDVVFEGVEVPESSLVELRPADTKPKNPAGFILFSTLLNYVYLGVALAARDAAVDYARLRVPAALGKPLVEMPAIQEKIGRIQLLIETATALNDGLVARFDNAGPNSVGAHDVGVVKLFVRDAVVDASDRAVQLAGGGGLVLENTLERHYRDALCGRVHGPADDIVIRGLAETVLRQ